MYEIESIFFNHAVLRIRTIFLKLIPIMSSEIINFQVPKQRALDNNNRDYFNLCGLTCYVVSCTRTSVMTYIRATTN